jgi:hypothetical protein
MPKITNFQCKNEQGAEIMVDAYGNNVALNCPKCGHPILIVTLQHKPGADQEHQAKCRR